MVQTKLYFTGQQAPTTAVWKIKLLPAVGRTAKKMAKNNLTVSGRSTCLLDQFFVPITNPVSEVGWAHYKVPNFQV